MKMITNKKKKILQTMALLILVTLIGTAGSAPAARSLAASVGAAEVGPTTLELTKLPVSVPQANAEVGGAVALSGDTAALGGRLHDGAAASRVGDRGVVHLLERQGGPGEWTETREIMAADAQDGDWFGSALDLEGDTLVVGASREDGGAGDPADSAGAVYIFERDQGGPDLWGQVVQLHASDSTTLDEFGISVALEGDYVLVGAPYANGGTGAAYLFHRNEGGADNWGELKILTADDAQSDDALGFAVDISDTTIAVGAPLEKYGAGDPIFGAGAVYLFEKDTGGTDNWGQTRKLFATSSDEGDNFGRAVALDTDTLLIGIPDEDGGVGNPLGAAGAVHVHNRDRGGLGKWGFWKELTATERLEDAYFGEFLALDGDLALIGTRYDDSVPDDTSDDTGAAYLFSRQFGGIENWGLLARVIGSDTESRDEFGAAVALDGDRFVVGATHEDGGVGNPSNRTGAGYLFRVAYPIYLPVIVRTP
jgi:hypothetical protein